jgi:YegS/Rv2252/BmrU family lipid kinase
MKLLAIVNAASAGGRTGRRWPQIEAALRTAGVDFDAVFTEGPGHAAELTIEALSAGRQLIGACGGDGTISEVVNGLIDEHGTARSKEVALALLPSGTGGDFRKSLGIDADPAAAAAVIAGGRRRRIDAGLIEYEDGERPRRFINIASCGVGYEVDRRINALSFKPGTMTYGLVSLYSTLRHRPVPASVTVDGAEVQGAYMWIALANGRYFGGGMMAAPEAELDDGMLDVVLASTGRIQSLTGARRIYSGTHIENPGVLMLRGRTIEIVPLKDAKMGFDVDGEALGLAPAKVSALPGALEICTPQRRAS